MLLDEVLSGDVVVIVVVVVVLVGSSLPVASENPHLVKDDQQSSASD